MRKRLTWLHNCLLLMVLIFTSSGASADTQLSVKNFWNDLPSTSSEKNKPFLSSRTLSARSDARPLKYRALSMDEVAFQTAFRQRSSNLAARTVDATLAPVITVPLPEGGEVSLKLEETSVMAPKLALQFPHLKTWKATGIDLAIYGRIDFTTQGFHAMLVMPDGDTIFIEPDKEAPRSADFSEQGAYLSFSKHSNKELFKQDFHCAVHTDDSQILSSKTVTNDGNLLARPAANLLTYRLAVAATGEYTEFHGDKNAAFSAIVTTINRVNEIYERDLGIHLELVPQELDLIYTNPETDPYTNNDVSALVDENILNLSNSAVLGTTQFDIGHVFGAGNVGGLAFVGSTCNSLYKAGGATGISSPIGDAFVLDYVAHEMGHQMGGTHTFNSFCSGTDQRSAATAVEPGSGSTIMSYAGLCQSNDIQSAVDPQFHAVSIEQIMNYSRSQGGSLCGLSSVVTNENPVVDAGPDFTVPASTPLMLYGNGSDLDGDALTYTWEQSDAGIASDVDIDTGDNALIRSRIPSVSGARYIPRISDLLAGVSVRGERLPITNRNIEFVVSARDGLGGVQSDVLNVQVYDTGSSFSVTSPTTSRTYIVGDSVSVKWNVAGTDVSPISCPSVDISLVSSSGSIFKVTTTENNGTYLLSIPANTPLISNARIMVSCSDGRFFNISGVDLISSESLARVVGSPSIVTESGGGSIYLLLYPMLLLAIFASRRKYKFFWVIR